MKTILTLFLFVYPALLFSQSEKNDIINLVTTAYVEGIHNNGPVADIRSGFHPDFAMLRLSDNEIIPVLIEEWIAAIEDRRNNNQASEHGVEGKFKNIDITGNAAFVKLELYRQERLIFTDYLLLYKFDEGWKIVSKTFFRH